MTNFNCACPAIQRGQGSGFLSEGSSRLTACMSEQRRFWRDCADAQARLNLRCSHRPYVPNSLDAVHMVFEIVYECKMHVLFDLTNLKNRKNDDVYVLHCLILDITRCLCYNLIYIEGRRPFIME